MRTVLLVGLLLLGFAASARAQAPDAGARLSLAPRFGLGRSLGGYLLEYGAEAAYPARNGLTPRIGVSGQFLAARCAVWCVVSPWTASAGVDYFRRPGWLGPFAGLGVGVYRVGGGGRSGREPGRSYLAWDARGGYAESSGRGWRWDVRMRVIVPEEDNSMPDFQFVLSLANAFPRRLDR